VKILATSGGFLPSDYGLFQWRRGPLIEHAIELAGSPERPRFCYLGTAQGDSLNGVAGFYRAFAGSDVRASHLELFSMPNVPDVRAHLLAQDVVWVGGGSVANLLAVWRVHGLDEVMREAWQAGVVLGGVSAGSICWHVGGTTDSFGLDLRPVTDGLALLPYGNGVHYDTEERRRPLLHRLVADGAAHVVRHRRRGRPVLRRHRPRGGRQRPPRRGGVPGRARPGRPGRRDAHRAPAAHAGGDRLSGPTSGRARTPRARTGPCPR
jgi:peptidase E